MYEKATNKAQAAGSRTQLHGLGTGVLVNFLATVPARQLMNIAQAAHALRIIGALIMGTGLFALSAICLGRPRFASSMYGLPVGNAGNTDWVLVAGVRDLGLGIATLALQIFEPRALRVFAPAIMIVPAADAALTLARGGSAADAAIHALGTVAIGILSICAWLDPALGDIKGKRA